MEVLSSSGRNARLKQLLQCHSNNVHLFAKLGNLAFAHSTVTAAGLQSQRSKEVRRMVNNNTQDRKHETRLYHS